MPLDAMVAESVAAMDLRLSWAALTIGSHTAMLTAITAATSTTISTKRPTASAMRRAAQDRSGARNAVPANELNSNRSLIPTVLITFLLNALHSIRCACESDRSLIAPQPHGCSEECSGDSQPAPQTPAAQTAP